MNEAAHQLHIDYSKPMDQCAECLSEDFEKLAEEYVEGKVYDALESSYHNHGARR